MSKPAKIMGILGAKPGKAEELRTLLAELQSHSRAEPGNLRWDIWQDEVDPNRLVLDELYTDKAASDLHRRTPHFQNYLGRINDLAERTALALAPVEVG